MKMLNRFSFGSKGAIFPCIFAIGFFLSDVHAQTVAHCEIKKLVLIPIDDDLLVPLLVNVKPANQANPARLAEMRNYVTGNATVDRLPGDTMHSLAQEAYGDACNWWIIAEANNVMSDSELSTLSRIIIPNIESASNNSNVIQVGDDGVSFHFFNTITGYTWQQYYIPAVSQIAPPVIEDNPNWLIGLAFVNGNDRWRANDFYISRSYPNPVVSGHDLRVQSSSAPEFSRIELPIDINAINRLPTFTDVEPPPPPIKAAPGSDPKVAVDMMKKFPDIEVLDVIRIKGIKIVTVDKSVVEVIPTLKDQPLLSWGPNATWNDVPGGYDKDRKLIIIATNSNNHGTRNLASHELAHAYNDVMDQLSEKPDFQQAFLSDYSALEKADIASQGYYSAPDDNPGAIKPTFTRARSEAFAEGMSNYFNGEASWFSDKPALLKYFQSYNRPQPVRQP